MGAVCSVSDHVEHLLQVDKLNLLKLLCVILWISKHSHFSFA